MAEQCGIALQQTCSNHVLQIPCQRPPRSFFGGAQFGGFAAVGLFQRKDQLISGRFLEREIDISLAERAGSVPQIAGLCISRLDPL
ncbi:hypothetical protein D3Y57_05180 (plasmid) [Sphingomonas paeninsulae]|uniref:Uncharacterized protein n=1 Tax=Sphingomonas paeninsulae TaxID=2319844 RepID=A0A494TIX8_SPHPE|nr:hypothetical protein D3Y57_05180 [Sphingomonas paeninsulae]